MQIENEPAADSIEGEPLSRRERLKQERERRILEAAATVFARKGFHQATIREIAELANVADGTIYNYYANKRDLLMSMSRHVVADSASDALKKFQVEDDHDFLAAILGERFGFLERNADFVQAMFSEVWANGEFREQYFGEVIMPLLQLMEGYLQARIEAGTIRPVNTSVVVQAMAGSFIIFLLLSQPGCGGWRVELSADQVVEDLVDFFLLGLQPRPEQEEVAA